MDRDVYANPEVREYLSRRFVTIKLDAEAPDPARYQGKTYTSTTLADERFKINSYPATIFLKSDGQHSTGARLRAGRALPDGAALHRRGTSRPRRRVGDVQPQASEPASAGSVERPARALTGRPCSG